MLEMHLLKITCCVVLVLSFWATNTSAASALQSLGSYAGIYRLGNGEFPACKDRAYVNVALTNRDKLFTVNRRGERQEQENWQWLRFDALNGDSQLLENNFGSMRYSKSVVERTGTAWQIRLLYKSCKVRFFCGPWKVQQTILINSRAMQINLLAGEQQCTYHRVD